MPIHKIATRGPAGKTTPTQVSHVNTPVRIAAPIASRNPSRTQAESHGGIGPAITRMTITQNYGGGNHAVAVAKVVLTSIGRTALFNTRFDRRFRYRSAK
jgi:hypothetical protein